MARYRRTNLQALPTGRHGPVPEERRQAARNQVQAGDPAGDPAGRPQARVCPITALQLREKQKLRRMYGVLERQFRNYYQKAARHEGLHGRKPAAAAGGAPGQRRLPDGIRRHARRGAPAGEPQRLKVNGEPGEHSVVPGAAGDNIEVSEKAKPQPRIKSALPWPSQVGFPEWVEVDDQELVGTFKNLPGPRRHPARHQREPGRRALLQVIAISTAAYQAGN